MDEVAVGGGSGYVSSPKWYLQVGRLILARK